MPVLPSGWRRGAYRAALARDPGFLPAQVNQSAFEEARGRTQATEIPLRRTVLAHPAAGEPRYALVPLQVWRGRVANAAGTLAEAPALAPDEPRFALCTGARTASPRPLG
jgi:Flp pilus assembly protein TadD